MRAAFALLAASVLLAAPLSAQRGPTLDFEEGPGWRPTLGARALWDYRDEAPAVGVFARLPVPSLPITLTPGGDLIFYDGLVERQGVLDVTLDLSGGLYAGGGPVVLNSVFQGSPDRKTKVGYGLVAGLRAGGGGPFGVLLELRWIEVQEFSPNFVGLAVTWGTRRRR